MKIFIRGLLISALLFCIAALQCAPASALTATTQTGSSQRISTAFKRSWPWYVSRATGIVASVLLVLLILSGIGQITGLTYRLLEPVHAWKVHRALGIGLGVSALLHVLVLLFDTYTRFSVTDLFVPFMSADKNIYHGKLALALGIFAFYAGAVVIITSLTIKDKHHRLWRILHYLSYALVVLTFFHGIMSGTDLARGILRGIWMAGGVIIALAIGSRAWRAKTLN